MDMFADPAMVPMLVHKYKVSNIKSEPDQVELKIISQAKPVEDAVPVQASLEDVFLYYFDEKAGDGSGLL